MRPLHHKIFSLSALSINWFFRRLFWLLFLLTTGIAIGLAIGLLKQLSDIEKEDILKVLILGISLPITFILWFVFYRAHRNRSDKEGKHSLIEYLEELKERNALSEADFVREKIKILED
jgi:hypothetical protein